jgi:nucleoside-diphosphate-sugar epimerase
MRVLLTGASGYVGRHACDSLIARGIELHAVSRLPRPAVRGITWHQAGLLEPGSSNRLIETIRPDAILHLAWDVTPGQYWTSPGNHAWRAATGELARVAAATGVTRFVGAGTCAEYDWSSGYCDEAVTPLAPASLYGQSKLGAWREVEAAGGGSMRAAWGRLFYLFGGEEHPSRLVPSVATALLRGEPALCSDGLQVRDFLHVADAADALVALLLSPVDGPVNIASGEPRAVKDIIDAVSSRLARPDLVRLGARSSNEAPTVTASVARLRDAVKWRPSKSFSDRMDQTVAYWRKTRIKRV